jgi:uncharacterized protein YbjT (DUF2867 family)
MEILLTGATGYVGGRLLAVLGKSGRPIRCLARRPEFLRSRSGAGVEPVSGDVFDRASLLGAMRGIHTAYYLVHSMAGTGRFEERDRLAARNFAGAAHEAGVRRIIYLGGLGAAEGELSSHLRSRHEVGEQLRSTGVPVVEFRASIIIGSGSLSFELIRALAERLPVMITPRWMDTLTQPIAIEDIVEYLTMALELPPERSAIFEIGGADKVTYGDLIREYARQRGLKRLLISVPVLTPRLSSLWLGLVTPVYARIGRHLIDGVRNPTLVRDDSALRVFSLRPMGIRKAVERALRNEDREFAETRWSDALSSSRGPAAWGGVRFGVRIVDSRVMTVECSAALAFAPIRRLGGRTGWYYGDWLWRLRGWIDLLVGGPGLRRGRRDPEHLQTGDALDFWRVEAYTPDRELRLLAEMKLPGRAWLEFEIEGEGSSSTIRQTAVFDPIGLAGLAYWYLAYPIHLLVFRGMLRGIARRAQTESSHPPR